MENLLLTFQRPPNNEVPLNDEANGEEDESRALIKKDVDDILAKAKEEDTLKEHGIKPPYPLWMVSRAWTEVPSSGPRLGRVGPTNYD